MASLRQRSWYPGAVSGTVALAVAASVPRPLALGGLAPLAVVAAVAALVGVPVARAEWRDREPPATTRGHAVAALGEVLLVAWLSAVWASVLPGLPGAVGAVLIWGVGWGLTRFRADLAVFGLAVLCMAQAVLAASLGWVEAAPWTLLQPVWSAWDAWLPWSLVTGLLLAGAGLAHWSRSAKPPPGTAHVPWLVAGGALLASLGAASRAGSRFEADLGFEVDAIALGVASLAIAAAVGSSLMATARPGRQAALGAALGVWFCSAEPAVVDWLFAVWLPLGMAVALAALALRLDGGPRLASALACGLAITALVLGWPGVPASPPVAVGCALTGVVLLWLAGTRGLLESRP